VGYIYNMYLHVYIYVYLCIYIYIYVCVDVYNIYCIYSCGQARRRAFCKREGRRGQRRVIYVLYVCMYMYIFIFNYI